MVTYVAKHMFIYIYIYTPKTYLFCYTYLLSKCVNVNIHLDFFRLIFQILEAALRSLTIYLWIHCIMLFRYTTMYLMSHALKDIQIVSNLLMWTALPYRLIIVWRQLQNTFLEQNCRVKDTHVCVHNFDFFLPNSLSTLSVGYLAPLLWILHAKPLEPLLTTIWSKCQFNFNLNFSYHE